MDGENLSDRSMTWWADAKPGDRIYIAGPAFNVCIGNSKKDLDGDILHFYEAGQGTSLATALLGGVAALWLGHHGRNNLIDLFDAQHGIKLQEAFTEVLKPPLSINVVSVLCL